MIVDSVDVIAQMSLLSNQMSFAKKWKFKKLLLLPYESVQQQLWVWIPPLSSPFFFSLPPFLFAVSSQWHTL